MEQLRGGSGLGSHQVIDKLPARATVSEDQTRYGEMRAPDGCQPETSVPPHGPWYRAAHCIAFPQESGGRRKLLFKTMALASTES